MLANLGLPCAHKQKEHTILDLNSAIFLEC